MPVPIFGLAKAVQMVAAGLERGESGTTIQGRLIDTGAAESIEAVDEAWRLGNLAFSAGAQLALGNTAAADRLIAQLAQAGAGAFVATAKVEITLTPEQRESLVAAGALKQDEPVYRTVQVNVGAEPTAESIAAALQADADEMQTGSDTPGFGGGGTPGLILPYSIVRLP